MSARQLAIGLRPMAFGALSLDPSRNFAMAPGAPGAGGVAAGARANNAAESQRTMMAMQKAQESKMLLGQQQAAARTAQDDAKRFQEEAKRFQQEAEQHRKKLDGYDDKLRTHEERYRTLEDQHRATQDKLRQAVAEAARHKDELVTWREHAKGVKDTGGDIISARLKRLDGQVGRIMSKVPALFAGTSKAADWSLEEAPGDPEQGAGTQYGRLPEGFDNSGGPLLDERTGEGAYSNFGVPMDRQRIFDNALAAREGEDAAREAYEDKVNRIMAGYEYRTPEPEAPGEDGFWARLRKHPGNYAAHLLSQVAAPVELVSAFPEWTGWQGSRIAREQADANAQKADPALAQYIYRNTPEYRGMGTVDVGGRAVPSTVANRGGMSPSLFTKDFWRETGDVAGTFKENFMTQPLVQHPVGMASSYLLAPALMGATNTGSGVLARAGGGDVADRNAFDATSVGDWADVASFAPAKMLPRGTDLALLGAGHLQNRLRDATRLMEPQNSEPVAPAPAGAPAPGFRGASPEGAAPVTVPWRWGTPSGVPAAPRPSRGRSGSGDPRVFGGFNTKTAGLTGAVSDTDFRTDGSGQTRRVVPAAPTARAANGASLPVVAVPSPTTPAAPARPSAADPPPNLLGVLGDIWGRPSTDWTPPGVPPQAGATVPQEAPLVFTDPAWQAGWNTLGRPLFRMLAGGSRAPGGLHSNGVGRNATILDTPGDNQMRAWESYRANPYSWMPYRMSQYLGASGWNDLLDTPGITQLLSGAETNLAAPQ